MFTREVQLKYIYLYDFWGGRMCTVRKLMGLFLLLFVVVGCLPVMAQAAALGMEDGCYRVPVTLWHEKNARLSMGAKGLAEQAELVVENGQGRLYLEACLTDNNGIHTSLMHFYYQEGGQFVRASSADWQLMLPNMQSGRPSIFEMPLNDKTEFYPVLVDPQVIFMGGTPIPARLKVDWEKAETLESSNLQARALAAPSPNLGGPIWLSVSGIEARIPNDALTAVPDLSAGNVLPDEMTKLKAAAGVSQGMAWKVSLNAPLLSIGAADIYDIEKLRTPLPTIPMTVYLPKSANESVASLYVFAPDGSKKEFSLVAEGARWRADGVPSGTFLLAEGKASAAASTQKATPPATQKASNRSTPMASKATKANTVVAKKPTTKPATVTPNVLLNGAPLNSDTIDAQEEGKEEKKPTTTNKKHLAPREHKGVIATVISIFMILIATGIAAWRKNYPIFSEEIARYKYLKGFERTVLK